MIMYRYDLKFTISKTMIDYLYHLFIYIMKFDQQIEKELVGNFWKNLISKSKSLSSSSTVNQES